MVILQRLQIIYYRFKTALILAKILGRSIEIENVFKIKMEIDVNNCEISDIKIVLLTNELRKSLLH